MQIPFQVKKTLRLALEEDIGSGDITTGILIAEKQRSSAVIIAKGTFIVAGLPFVQEVFTLYDPEVSLTARKRDGARVKRGDIIAVITGSTRTLLACERVSLNILQRLSGIATLTHRFADRLRGTAVRLADTRKTTPGLRYMEKYAVVIGGGENHRFGLSDGILIKDNHIAAAGGVAAAVRAAKKVHHLLKIEVEVKNLREVDAALAAGADVIMLDNMPVAAMKKAVAKVKGRARIEASGNVTLENIREIALTGVDVISVGALTHSAAAADISMRITKRSS